MNARNIGAGSDGVSAAVGVAPTDASVRARHELDTLRKVGAQGFDPARFHYLTRLADRAMNQHGSVKQLVEARLMLELMAFRGRFERARHDARRVMDAVDRLDPELATRLERLYATGDFKAIERAITAIKASDHETPLAALVRQLAQATGQADFFSAEDEGGASGELKTMRYFRTTWSSLSVKKQLAKAFEQPPPNAGPINSHSLVLRSLAMMQDISPDYLNRFTTYVDTLLRLDQHGESRRAGSRRAATEKADVTPRKRRSGGAR